MYTCDVESCIESKCQNEDRTGAGGLQVIITVKDGNKCVRGEEINYSKSSNPVGNEKHSGSTKSNDGKLLSISWVSKAFPVMKVNRWLAIHVRVLKLIQSRKWGILLWTNTLWSYKLL